MDLKDYLMGEEKGIIDNSKNRVIYLSGMIYGPGEKKKKKFMREFEAIFSTLKTK